MKLKKSDWYWIGGAGLLGFLWWKFGRIRLLGPPAPAPYRGWIFPVPVWNSMIPEITSGYGERTGGMHGGVDILYEQPDGRWYTKHPTYTARWFHPDGIPAIAVGPGRVVRVRDTYQDDDIAQNILIDHGTVGGKPVATYYQHMDSTWVKEGQSVFPGQKLGIIGHTGKTGIRHLHFEWRTTGATRIDPEPIIEQFPIRIL